MGWMLFGGYIAAAVAFYALLIGSARPDPWQALEEREEAERPVRRAA